MLNNLLSSILSGKKLIVLFISCAAFIADIKAQIHLSVTPTNISCFGGRNGSITTSVSNGTSPYTYLWSTGATTSSISALAAGYYAVTVTDATSATQTNNATLTEPTALSLTLTPSVYNTVNNISCPSCCNGYINISVSGGITSYSYAWSSSVTGYSSTSGNISNLCKGIYTLTVTDANGCTITDNKTMSEPDKDTWTMTGNTGSNPSTQFIGTTDNKDLVFKTNNSEAMRLKSNKNILFNKLADTISYSALLVDSNGQLLRVNSSDTTLPAAIGNASPWLLGGNNNLGAVDLNYLGTQNNRSLVFKTNANNGGGERMRITVDGNIGIGTTNPTTKLQVNDGTIYLRGEDQGLIVDAQTSKRVGFMKYTSKEAGIWRLGSQDFEIGRVTTGTLLSPSAFTTDLYIDGAGKTFLGFSTLPCASCTTALYKLYVNGGIAARDVKVTANNFPDFVFNSSYQLMSIYELEQFIKQNKHLPDIPSAAEIEKNDGYELGDMVQKLLQKAEEQSLYIIAQQKQIDELKKEMNQLKRKSK